MLAIKYKVLNLIRKLNRFSFSMLIFGLTLGSASIAANDSSQSEFFKLQKLDSVSLAQLWQANEKVEVFSTDTTMMKLWYSSPIFSNTYNNQNVPVAIFLIAESRITSEPVGYQITATKSARVARAREGGGQQHDDALYAFVLEENNCEGNCEQGRVLVYKNSEGYTFKVDNVQLQE